MTEQIICGDSLTELKKLPSESVDCMMTSPPYWALRDYGEEGQLGLEPTFEEYINKLCNIMDQVKRVLKKSGTCWVNLGDTYYGSGSLSDSGRAGFSNNPPEERWKRKITKNQLPNKCLTMIPERFAIEMVNRGWILRNQIIWQKPNCMPSPIKDRFTVDFEKVFLFVKNKTYWFETQYEELTSEPQERKTIDGKSEGKLMGSLYGRVAGSNAELGKTKRTTWSIPTQPFSEGHFAAYPEALVETPIKSGCPEEGTVLDPFMGSGTTGLVAKKLKRNFIGIDINKEYCQLAREKINGFQRKDWKARREHVTLNEVLK